MKIWQGTTIPFVLSPWQVILGEGQVENLKYIFTNTNDMQDKEIFW